MDLGLKGKKVLITASSGGIGKETARLFLEEGAKVLLNGRGLEKLADALKSFSDQYGAENVMSVCGDACDQKTVEDIAETVEHQLEGLDILIPCVGTGKGISSDRLDPTEWHYMMDKNVHGTIALIHACIPFLRKSSMPAIVLISSVVACSRASAPYAYAAAKSTLLSLNSYLAGDYEQTGIRCNCVLPGNIFFKGGRWEELKHLDPEGTMAYIDSSVPMKRFGTPEEVANMIVFLSSSKATFINGASIAIDGGQNRRIM